MQHPVGEPIIKQVLLCDLYERRPGHVSTAHSLPGHLIQLTIEGEMEHVVEGRRYHVGPGCLLWYNEVEQVKIRAAANKPWRFYTWNFIAETLEAPPLEQRMRAVRVIVQKRFSELLGMWRDTDVSPIVRHLRVHAAAAALLAEILIEFDLAPAPTVEMANAARLWWVVESHLRKNLQNPMSLPQMSQWSGRSAATLGRACHAAVGVPPMKRLKHIRMNLAQGLVYRSELSVNAIAHRLGYERIHEFSRDYRKHFGLSPRADRTRNADSRTA